MPEIKRYTAPLMCTLNREEIHDLGKQLAAKVQECLLEEADQALTKKAMKQKLDEMEAERNRLSSLVDDGVEKREVECVVQADFGTMKALTIRLDTGEVIHERELKPEEMQLGLEITPKTTEA